MLNAHIASQIYDKFAFTPTLGQKKIIESFNNSTKEQKEEFVNALEQALNFNPKKK